MDRGRLSAATLSCLLILSLLAVGMSMPVAANGGYTITIDGSVDTPTREVPVFGGKDISAIAKADVGDTVTVDVEAPSSSTTYTTVLVNSDQKTVDFVDMQGDDSGDFDLENPRRPGYDTLNPGSYLVAVENSTTGAREKIHPLVIKGFDTSVSAPGSATVGDQISVDVTVTRVNDSATNDRVEVVIADEEQNISTTATQDGSQYTASIDTEKLDAGSYNVYATVRGEEEVYGGEEVIYGISDAESVSLEAADSGSTTGDSGAGGGGGGGGGPVGETATTQTSATAEGTESTATVTSAPQSDTATSVGSSTSSQPDTESPADNTPVGDTDEPGTETESGTTEVVTPSTPSSVTTETSLPGFGTVSMAVAGLLGVVILRLRLD